MAKGSPFTFQQDGAPAHTANKVQQWLRDNVDFWDKSMWPPQSPDLNPLDFSVWWHVESKACAARHPNVEALKSTVNKVWADMSEEYLIKVCKDFRRRLEAVIEANGGHIP